MNLEILEIDDTIKVLEQNIATYEACFSESYLSTLRKYIREKKIIEWLKELKEYKKGK